MYAWLFALKYGVLSYRSKVGWLFLLNDNASMCKGCNDHNQCNSLYAHVAHK